MALKEVKLLLYGDASDPPRESLPSWGSETEDEKRAKADRVAKARTRMLDKYQMVPAALRALVGLWVGWRVVRRLADALGLPWVAGAAAYAAVVARYLGPPPRPSPAKFRSPFTSLPLVGEVVPLALNRHRLQNYLLETLRAEGFRSMEILAPTGMQFALLTDTRDLEFMLKTHPSWFLKNRPDDFSDVSTCFAELLGRGIFGVDGEEWRDMRKIASHAFSADRLSHAAEDVFNAHAARLADLLEPVADSGRVVDMQEIFQAAVFDVFCDLALGVSFHTLDEFLTRGKRHEFLVAFDAAQLITAMRFIAVPAQWHLKRILGAWLGWGDEAALVHHLRVLRGYIEPVLKARLAEPDEEAAKRKDLLALYIDHARKTNQPHIVQGVAGLELITNFLVAGRDTTSCLLSNMLKLLTPAARDRLVRDLLPHQDRLKFDAQQQMSYPNACVNEVLRMAPSVGLDLHIAIKRVELPSGLVCREGCRAVVPILALGRDPKLWSDPDDFKPERWIRVDDATGRELPVKRVDDVVHPVFWAQSRLCLGHALARFEALVMASKLLTKFDIEPVKREPRGVMGEMWMTPVAFYKDGVKCVVSRKCR